MHPATSLYRFLRNSVMLLLIRWRTTIVDKTHGTRLGGANSDFRHLLQLIHFRRMSSRGRIGSPKAIVAQAQWTLDSLFLATGKGSLHVLLQVNAE